MKVAVVVYPGSNADWDVLHVLRDVLRVDTEYVFHTNTSLSGFDAVIIPGGFSYGDYLRCGAIARSSPISASVCEFANRGAPVLGICNGFQVLTELHLLPGALCRNEQLLFACHDVFLRVENTGVFTGDLRTGQCLKMPIAHADGRYHCDTATLRRLRNEKRIAFRYCNALGEVLDPSAVNGSLESIAGIYNEKRNVLGMMPHPERASEDILGSNDGLRLFESLRRHLQGAQL